MRKIISFMPLLLAVIAVGCSRENLPPGMLEFEVPTGKFRVTTPENWVETPELGGYTAVQSADLDLVFGVISLNSSAGQMSGYSNPREYNVNGREITVYDSQPGGTARYFGVEHNSEDVYHGTVTLADRSYHVILVRSKTVELRDAHEQIFVDLAATLQPVP